MSAPPTPTRARHASVGLADLLRSLADLHPEVRMDPARWDAHARALGLERTSPPVPHEEPRTPNPAPRQDQDLPVPTPAVSEPLVSLAPHELPPVPFWRAVEFNVDDPALDASRSPRARRGPRPLTEADLRPPANPPAFDSPPIEPWSRLWPRLAAHLAAERPSRAPDTRALVNIIARALPLARIPRRRRRAWADRALIVHDRRPSQAWLYRDQARLTDKLRQAMGDRGVEVRLLDAGPAGLAFDPRRGHYAEWSRVAQGTPALVVSAFARETASLSPPTDVAPPADAPLTGTEQAWRALGRRLVQHGYHPAALVALPAARAARGLAPNWSVLPWERRAWEMTADSRSLTERAEQLLALAAPALAVPAALLRALRALLPADASDAGTEADAWTNPDVEPTAYGLRFVPERAQRWLERFGALPAPLQRQAWRLIQRWQQRYGREANAFSTWRLMGLPDDPVPNAHERTAAVVLANRMYNGEPSDPLQAALRTWFRRLDSLLPSAVDDHDELGPALARMRLACHADLATGPDKDIVRDVTVIHRAGGLWPVAPDAPADRTNPGSPVATLPIRGDALSYRGRPLSLDRTRAVVDAGAGPGIGPDALVAGGELRSELARVRLEPFTQPPWADAVGRDEYGLWVAFDIADVTVRMRWIPPGRFLMGSPDDEPGRDNDEGPRHEVIVTRGLWLGETPCTQALWTPVMGSNPSRFVSPERPVEQVSFDDVRSFLERLNQRHAADGPPFRLPTEAEWEYACRAGTSDATYAGPIDIRGTHDAPILDDIAWYGGNSGVDFELANGVDSSRWPQKQHDHQRAGTHPVARKRCNPWGLYDMLGNVYEWCDDGMRSYTSERVRNPCEPVRTHAIRVVRGGSWFGFARFVRAAFRYHFHPSFAYVILGFRLARGPAAQPEPAERAENRSGGAGPGGRGTRQPTTRR